MSDHGFAGLQMFSQVLGGFEERAQYRHEARALEENARLRLLAGEQQAAQSYREERQVSGAALAAMGESGFTVGTGTAADLLMQNALEREIEIAAIRAQAQGEAVNDLNAARDKRYAGRLAVLNGLLAAGGTAMSHMAGRDAQKKLDEAIERDRQSRLPRPRASSHLSERGLPHRRARLGVLTGPGY